MRGINPAETRRNLDRIVTQLTQRGVPGLIAGMRAPNNWGEDYRQRFDSIFADLASRHGTLLYPFFLETVALDPKLNQADGLHPNAKGIARIVEGIGPKVVELIARAAARRTPG